MYIKTIQSLIALEVSGTWASKNIEDIIVTLSKQKKEKKNKTKIHEPTSDIDEEIKIVLSGCQLVITLVTRFQVRRATTETWAGYEMSAGSFWYPRPPLDVRLPLHPRCVAHYAVIDTAPAGIANENDWVTLALNARCIAILFHFFRPWVLFFPAQHGYLVITNWK